MRSWSRLKTCLARRELVVIEGEVLKSDVDVGLCKTLDEAFN